MILETLILAEYFTVKSGQEIDLALVVAVNFMCQKFFFLRFEQGVRTPRIRH